MGFNTILFVVVATVCTIVMASDTSDTCPSVGPPRLNTNVNHSHSIEYYVDSLHDCVMACRSSPDCKAFQYDRIDYSCKIYLRDVSTLDTHNLLGQSGGDAVYERSALNLGPCNGHNCKGDERCFPAGDQYFCKKAIDVCFMQLPGEVCFRRYKRLYMIKGHMGTSEGITEVYACALYCYKNHPTYKAFTLFALDDRCRCFEISVADAQEELLGIHNKGVPSAATYEKIK